MNDFSEPMTISPTARKLVERYGVAPEVMEEIISDSRSRTEIPRPTPVVPVQQTVNTVPEAANVKPAVVPVVANYVAVPPAVVPPVVVEHRSEGSPLSAVTVILGILLILALVGLIYLWQGQRANTNAQATLDSLRIAERVGPASVAMPIDTATTPSIVQSPPPPTPVVHHTARKRRALNRGAYFTSSPLSAQEHLAELRASGNHRAYLETVNRKGATFYRLHNGPKPKKRHSRS